MEWHERKTLLKTKNQGSEELLEYVGECFCSAVWGYVVWHYIFWVVFSHLTGLAAVGDEGLLGPRPSLLDAERLLLLGLLLLGHPTAEAGVSSSSKSLLLHALLLHAAPLRLDWTENERMSDEDEKGRRARAAEKAEGKVRRGGKRQEQTITAKTTRRKESHKIISPLIVSPVFL